MFLHFATQDLVHIRLILLAARPKPGKDVPINANADQMLNWPIKATYLNFRWQRFYRRRIGQINFRIRQVSKLLQFAPLPVSEGLRKERARGDPLFARR